MSCSNMEERKKRMVVPIVAIMMCAVALVGLGYAFSSSVTSSNTVTDGGNFYVDIAKEYSTFTDVGYNYQSNDVADVFDIRVEMQAWDKEDGSTSEGDKSGATGDAVYLMVTSDTKTTYALTAGYSTDSGTTFNTISFTVYSIDSTGKSTGTPITTLETGVIYLLNVDINKIPGLTAGGDVKIKLTAVADTIADSTTIEPANEPTNEATDQGGDTTP